jgi:hypothetical protein
MCASSVALWAAAAASQSWRAELIRKGELNGVLSLPWYERGIAQKPLVSLMMLVGWSWGRGEHAFELLIRFWAFIKRRLWGLLAR